MKYTFNFKNYRTEQITNKDEIINKCISLGTRYQVEFDGKTYAMNYYSLLIDDRQYWAFINDEPSKVFDGSFKLKLVNLIDEHGQAETDW